MKDYKVSLNILGHMSTVTVTAEKFDIDENQLFVLFQAGNEIVASYKMAYVVSVILKPEQTEAPTEPIKNYAGRELRR